MEVEFESAEEPSAMTPRTRRLGHARPARTCTKVSRLLRGDELPLKV